MTVTVLRRAEGSSLERMQVQVYGELRVPEWSISANWAMGMARGIEYWLKMRIFMFDQVFICKHLYYTKWDAVTVYLYVCVGYYATRCSDLEVCLGSICMRSKNMPAH